MFMRACAFDSGCKTQVIAGAVAFITVVVNIKLLLEHVSDVAVLGRCVLPVRENAEAYLHQ